MYLNGRKFDAAGMAGMRSCGISAEFQLNFSGISAEFQLSGVKENIVMWLVPIETQFGRIVRNRWPTL